MPDVLRCSWRMATLVLAGVAGCFSDGGGHVGGETSTGGEASSSTGAAITSSGEDDSGPTCADGCFEPVCGDGVAMAPEECDDGDDDSTDVCTVLCTLAACGDGWVQGGEGCDAGPDNRDDGACTLGCQAAVCGDGKVQVGVEACDDGNAAAGDGCSPVCALEACGDGVVGGGEACDDGDASDADDCKSDCTPAVCGDGIVAVEATVPEACDDGNADEADGCTTACALPACGDGFVQPGEACDDGNMEDDDTCDLECMRVAYAVFVTSQSYAADLGGAAGGDARCMERAQAAGLPGVYKAWLSDGQNAGQRLDHSQLPYVLVDGALLAFDWFDLVNGNLNTSIDVDETGTQINAQADCDGPAAVWTGTDSNGTGDSGRCEEWTTISPLAEGQVGLLTASGTAWTAACKVGCAAVARLYCFEQPALAP